MNDWIFGRIFVCVSVAFYSRNLISLGARAPVSDIPIARDRTQQKRAQKNESISGRVLYLRASAIQNGRHSAPLLLTERDFDA